MRRFIATAVGLFTLFFTINANAVVLTGSFSGFIDRVEVYDEDLVGQTITGTFSYEACPPTDDGVTCYPADGNWINLNMSFGGNSYDVSLPGATGFMEVLDAHDDAETGYGFDHFLIAIDDYLTVEGGRRANGIVATLEIFEYIDDIITGSGAYQTFDWSASSEANYGLGSFFSYDEPALAAPQPSVEFFITSLSITDPTAVVSEPGVLLLMSFGLAALGLRRR